MSIAFTVSGIGFWASGLPSWTAACAFAHDGALPAQAPLKPSATLLPPNERRRAPDTVALALEAAQAACLDAGADASALPSVFVSTHGDLAITDAMCTSLVADPESISPTRFHNSVHNAASGYWTIGNACRAPATALSAFGASFGQGLLEAIARLADGAHQVLLVAYDGQSSGALARISRSEGLLAGALVLSRDEHPALTRCRMELRPGALPESTDALSRRYADNAMAPMLPLFAMLAGGGEQCDLASGPTQILHVTRVP